MGVNQPVARKVFVSEEIIEFFERIRESGAEEQLIHTQIQAFIEEVIYAVKNNYTTVSDIAIFNRQLGEEFLDNTIQGHSVRKPYGYAGDFEIIDKIYTRHITPNEKFRIWDEYFHQQAAPKAVVNRKTYFKRFLKDRLTSSDTLHMLNVASGPARDVFELYTELNNPAVLFSTCVEMEEKAIRYAKNLNHNFLDHLQFINQNIFRYCPSESYDIIWSAGLFDYFTDDLFVRILKRFKRWLKPGGEIVVGNFNEDHNPSRDYMELFGEWYLHHRSEEKLIDLATRAGFEQAQITIGKEEENVNLFLHVKD